MEISYISTIALISFSRENTSVESRRLTLVDGKGQGADGCVQKYPCCLVIARGIHHCHISVKPSALWYPAMQERQVTTEPPIDHEIAKYQFGVGLNGERHVKLVINISLEIERIKMLAGVDGKTFVEFWAVSLLFSVLFNLESNVDVPGS
ncbi:MAG: hypothetical protein IH612_03225 [Desulfofustis sp.]|nr:hypothetical protein [Desulfofustis sp.]